MVTSDLGKHRQRGLHGGSLCFNHLSPNHPFLRQCSLQPPPNCEIVCHLRGKVKDKLHLFYLEASASPRHRS